VVEDDQSVRRLTVELLQTSGYEVLSCAGAREALSIVERLEGRVDVVITDVVMPGMKGDELGDFLAKRFPGIKVLTSGYLDRALVGREGETFVVVPKPFSRSSLLRAVERVLDGSKE